MLLCYRIVIRQSLWHSNALCIALYVISFPAFLCFCSFTQSMDSKEGKRDSSKSPLVESQLPAETVDASKPKDAPQQLNDAQEVTSPLPDGNMPRILSTVAFS
jgi:hypothetical protein